MNQVKKVAVVGGGPAGLMAAEALSCRRRRRSHLYDAMPSVGRKFLLAGRGGLNLTHSEPFERLRAAASASAAQQLAPLLRAFGPEPCEGLGAGPGHRDLRRHLGARVPEGHEGRAAAACLAASAARRPACAFTCAIAGSAGRRCRPWPPRCASPTPDGEDPRAGHDAVVLALGGASWPRLGSDGAWAPWVQARGVGGGAPGAGQLRLRRRLERRISPTRFAGHALQVCGDPRSAVGMGRSFERKGEFVATATGIEGSLVYAASALAARRDRCDSGSATLIARPAAGSHRRPGARRGDASARLAVAEPAT